MGQESMGQESMGQESMGQESMGIDTLEQMSADNRPKSGPLHNPIVEARIRE